MAQQMNQSEQDFLRVQSLVAKIYVYYHHWAAQPTPPVSRIEDGKAVLVILARHEQKKHHQGKQPYNIWIVRLGADEKQDGKCNYGQTDRKNPV